MKKTIVAVAVLISAILAAPLSAGGGESCNSPNVICLDYVSGFTTDEAMASCVSHSGFTFAASKCARSGRVGICSVSKNGQVIDAIFYAEYDKAVSTCAAMNGIFSN